MTPAGMPATPQPGKVRRGMESALPRSSVRAPSRSQDRQNFAGFRESSLRVPGKHQFLAQRNVENAAPASNELDFKALFANQFRLQTGGARQVVSAAAILDDYSGNGPDPLSCCPNARHSRRSGRIESRSLERLGQLNVFAGRNAAA